MTAVSPEQSESREGRGREWSIKLEVLQESNSQFKCMQVHWATLYYAEVEVEENTFNN